MSRWWCVVFACGCAPELGVAEAPVTGTTIVSLTFDDTFANHAAAADVLAQRGLRGTFYVNSGRIGLAGYLTRDQLLAMQAAGHELGGHTVSHANLATLDEAEMRRQVCNDRVALLDAGVAATSFAYPFSGQDATARQVVADCGYNSARLVGGLYAAPSCTSCPYANPMPPADPYQLRTNESVKSDTTLATLQQYVQQAEDHGGGWVPIVMHHVCDGCDPLAISPATLAAFGDWLAARAALGTEVATVDAVIGGSLQPGVPGPPVGAVEPGSNLLRNASLEIDDNADQIPDCWQRGGTGTNSATFALVPDAFDGVVAQRIDVTSFTSGARRLVSRQDLGSCAPPVVPGHSYTFRAAYKATTPPIVSVYYRTAAGGWVWLAQSAPLPASASYATASYTTPPMPTAATALSVGLSIMAAGSITSDAYSLVDDQAVDTTPPTASISAPADGATVTGITPIWAEVSDNVGVYRVRFYLDGIQLGTRVLTSYRWNWDTATASPGVHQLAVQAEDAAGNATRSPSITVTVP
jgi:peptidoglycan/xylan/chitin deacetylase (PgdA/CDA1 family)